ncbi:Mobile element protein (plasmid) [Nostoc flagelliforme CCNUN1]|uniref:Mobile element protein n=1 Tax=Nostoc flagelliforme CCNUN1 TaxID=2038116 RepID=A0A2K8TA97_9NOSO|nr:Mobile element protein [Nostoc flagelliforme CCNUN1]
MVFKGLVKWGKNSLGWHFGFKLHLIINDCGELLAFLPKKPSIDIYPKDLPALPPAIF